MRLLYLVFGLVVFTACNQGRRGFSSALMRVDSIAETAPAEARCLLDSLSFNEEELNEEQCMYHALLDIRIKDKMYEVHTSDTLIKRITSFYEGYGDRAKLVRSYYYMGRVYSDLQDAPEALEYFQKALDTAGEEGDPLFLSTIYSQMGTLFYYQNVYDKALPMHEKSLYYTRLAGDSTTLSFVFRDMAHIYKGQDNIDSAICYFKQAADLALNYNERKIYSGILTELGSMYSKQKDYDKALSCLSVSVLDTAGREMDPTYVTLGRIYLEKNRLDSAEYYFRLVSDDANLYVKEGLYEYLSILNERKANYKDAVGYMRRLILTQDSIRAITRSREIRQMASLYNYQLREKENVRLREANDRIRHRVYRLLLFASLIFLVILVQTYRLRLLKKQMLQQAEQLSKERKANYERSQSFIDDNSRKIADLRDRALENEEARIQKDLLETANEQTRLQMKERSLCEEKLRGSSIYLKFHLEYNLESPLINEEDWEALRQILDQTYANFTSRLYMLYPKMTSLELRVCYLVKISVRVSDMAKILHRTSPAISLTRSRLYKKMTGESGTAQTFDQLILDM